MSAVRGQYKEIVINMNFQASPGIKHFCTLSNNAKITAILTHIETAVKKTQKSHPGLALTITLPEDWQHGPYRTDHIKALTQDQYIRFTKRLFELSRSYKCTFASSTSYLAPITQLADKKAMLARLKASEEVNTHAQNIDAHKIATDTLKTASIPFLAIRTAGTLIRNGELIHDHVKITPFIDDTDASIPAWKTGDESVDSVGPLCFDTGIPECFAGEEIILICREFNILQYLPGVKKAYALSNTNELQLRPGLQAVYYNDAIGGSALYSNHPESILGLDVFIPKKGSKLDFIPTRKLHLKQVKLYENTPIVLNQTHNYDLETPESEYLRSLWYYSFHILKSIPKTLNTKAKIVVLRALIEQLCEEFLAPYINLTLSAKVDDRRNNFNDELHFNIIPFILNTLQRAYNESRISNNSKQEELNELFRALAITILDTIEPLQLLSKMSFGGVTEKTNFDAVYSDIRQKWFLDLIKHRRASTDPLPLRAAESNTITKRINERIKCATNSKEITDAWNTFITEFPFSELNDEVGLKRTRDCIIAIADKYSTIGDQRNALATYTCHGGAYDQLSIEWQKLFTQEFNDKPSHELKDIDYKTRFLHTALGLYQKIHQLIRDSRQTSLVISSNHNGEAVNKKLSKAAALALLTDDISQTQAEIAAHDQLYAHIIAISYSSSTSRGTNPSIPLIQGQYYSAMTALQSVVELDNASQLGLIYAMGLLNKILLRDPPIAIKNSVVTHANINIKAFAINLKQQLSKPSKQAQAAILLKQLQSYIFSLRTKDDVIDSLHTPLKKIFQLKSVRDAYLEATILMPGKCQAYCHEGGKPSKKRTQFRHAAGAGAGTGCTTDEDEAPTPFLSSTRMTRARRRTGESTFTLS